MTITEFGELVLIILSIIIFLGGTIALIWYFVRSYPLEMERRKKEKQAYYEQCEKGLDYVFTQAKVLSKRKDFYWKSNINIPKSQEDFYAVFLTENGEKEFLIRADIYERIEEGQEGTLVTVNGNFFDFGDGEDIPLED